MKITKKELGLILDNLGLNGIVNENGITETVTTANFKDYSDKLNQLFEKLDNLEKGSGIEIPDENDPSKVITIKANMRQGKNTVDLTKLIQSIQEKKGKLFPIDVVHETKEGEFNVTNPMITSRASGKSSTAAGPTAAGGGGSSTAAIENPLDAVAEHFSPKASVVYIPNDAQLKQNKIDNLKERVNFLNTLRKKLRYDAFGQDHDSFLHIFTWRQYQGEKEINELCNELLHSDKNEITGTLRAKNIDRGYDSLVDLTTLKEQGIKLIKKGDLIKAHFVDMTGETEGNEYTVAQIRTNSKGEPVLDTFEMPGFINDLIATFTNISNNISSKKDSMAWRAFTFGVAWSIYIVVGIVGFVAAIIGAGWRKLVVPLVSFVLSFAVWVVKLILKIAFLALTILSQAMGFVYHLVQTPVVNELVFAIIGMTLLITGVASLSNPLGIFVFAFTCILMSNALRTWSEKAKDENHSKLVESHNRRETSEDNKIPEYKSVNTKISEGLEKMLQNIVNIFTIIFTGGKTHLTGNNLVSDKLQETANNVDLSLNTFWSDTKSIDRKINIGAHNENSLAWSSLYEAPRSGTSGTNVHSNNVAYHHGVFGGATPYNHGAFDASPMHERGSVGSVV